MAESAKFIDTVHRITAEVLRLLRLGCSSLQENKNARRISKRLSRFYEKYTNILLREEEEYEVPEGSYNIIVLGT